MGNDRIVVEIAGLKESSCGPFPCDENRTCGLNGCFPSGMLEAAVAELRRVIQEEYGGRVEVRLTLLDSGIPDHIRPIIEAEFPPLPIVLVNGRIRRIGRISLERIRTAIDGVG